MSYRLFVKMGLPSCFPVTFTMFLCLSLRRAVPVFITSKEFGEIVHLNFKKYFSRRKIVKYFDKKYILFQERV